MAQKKLLLFLVSIVIFCLFVYFSYLVAKESFTQIDFDLTVKLQDHLKRRFDFLFSLFSLIGSVEITSLVWLGLLITVLFKRYFLAALSLFLLPFALFIEIFGKLFVFHPAPPHFFYRGVIKFDFLPSQYVQTNYSYPSGHLTRTAFIIFFLATWFYLKLPIKTQLFLQPMLFAFLIIMIVSRIYLGEHWTSDVIGGVLLGSSLGILSGITIPKVKAKAFALWDFAKPLSKSY